MKWLLVIFVITMGADGRMTNAEMEHQIYASEVACNRAGEDFRKNNPQPRGTNSVSVCIPQNVFDD